MKKIIYVLSILIVLILLTSCSISTGKSYKADGFALGTIITQEVYGRDARQVSVEAMDKLKFLEDLMTINDLDSDSSKLSMNAGKGYVELNPETISVLKSARKISDLSDGAAFDITVAPVVKAWGIGTDNPQIPSEETLKKLVPLINYQDVQIDEASNKASLAKPGQMIDLGGIAKGYAGDVLREIYQKNGIKSGLINLGGNVIAVGSKPDGSPWSIGIQNPRSETGGIVGIIQVSDKAVVTSGDYQRYFEKDGKRYCHIIDPHTGYPADSGLMSVTIITSSSTDADGLAKAFVLGLDKGMDLVKKYNQSYSPADAIFITTDKKIFVTPGLHDNFKLEDESHEYTCIKKG
ncbi:MAG: FAD:protein FMN transferase [Desulfitobacteriaceae bacterium]|nr:FAD:protein FMN transferase [Desulfitobacteriaceae bacterium]MDD4345976.1 FAD:protein FMN transferase [Desulfitobacteriaceae bacterium]MDD4401007.1 FAD:protein FMN transferase [Desulfitobacteriaceae bacterium]